MLTEIVFALIGMRLAVIVVGASLAVFAFLRYLRGGRRGHLLLSVGFGLIAMGGMAEGITFTFLGWDLVAAHAAESAFSAGGLLSVLLAILLGRG